MSDLTNKPKFVHKMFDTELSYHWNIAKRLMDAMSSLPESVFHSNPGYGHGSPNDLFFHILRTDQAWRLGMETGRRLPPNLSKAEFQSLDSLRKGYLDEEKAWESLMQRLTDEELQGDVEITGRTGEVSVLQRWRIIQHLVFHGMQHFSEIAQILTNQGRSPGDLDFIFFE